MRLAFYKGRTRLFNRAVSWWTHGPYSHTELILGNEMDGTLVCASSSCVDGGVRFKNMALDDNHWDVMEIRGDSLAAYNWFMAHTGLPYDVLGLAGFVGRRGLDDKNKWFCSEACAAALGMEEPWRYDPNTLYVVAKQFLQI